MEELSADTLYFSEVLAASDVTDVDPFDLEERRNPTESKSRNLERAFWSAVKPRTFKVIERFFAGDLLMFGYSSRKYFDELGMGVFPGFRVIS